MNTGNTGNRYRLRKFAKVEKHKSETHPSAILVTLECGHNYVVIGGGLDFYQRLIDQGKRTRCNDCPIDKGR